MQRSHSSQLLAPLVLLALVLVAAPASATPVTLYADGTTTFGFDPVDVAAAITAGEAPPLVVAGLVGGIGQLSVTTPNGIPGTIGTSKANPSTGTSTWTVNNVSLAASFEDLVLVILGHDPNDPLGGFYNTANVGLSINTSDPRWFLIQPSGQQGFANTYLAYRLQDANLTPGESTPVPIEYRVGQGLLLVGGEFVFPRYSVAYVSIPVPEPSVLALLIGAVVVGWAAKRPK